MKTRLSLVLFTLLGIACSHKVERATFENVPTTKPTTNTQVPTATPTASCTQPRASGFEGQPTFTQLPISPTAFIGFDHDLLRVKFGMTSGTGHVVKQMVYEITRTQGLMLSEFSLRQDAEDLNEFAISITDAVTGADLTATNTDMSSLTSYVVVSFHTQNEIQRWGKEYTLHAYVGDSQSANGSAQSVITSFHFNTEDDQGYTGYITNQVTASGWYKSDFIYHVSVPTSGKNKLVPGAFIWANGSSSHSSNVLGKTGSCDWRNDMFFDTVPYELVTFQ